MLNRNLCVPSWKKYLKSTEIILCIGIVIIASSEDFYFSDVTPSPFYSLSESHFSQGLGDEFADAKILLKTLIGQPINATVWLVKALRCLHITCCLKRK